MRFPMGRNQLIAGICALIVLVTAFSMFRIGYNEDIIDSYQAVSNPLPYNSKIGTLDRFWQKYTGGTRNTSVTFLDAQRAEDAIDSAYRWMIGLDAVLIIALAGVIYKTRKS